MGQALKGIYIPIAPVFCIVPVPCILCLCPVSFLKSGKPVSDSFLFGVSAQKVGLVEDLHGQLVAEDVPTYRTYGARQVYGGLGDSQRAPYRVVPYYNA